MKNKVNKGRGAAVLAAVALILAGLLILPRLYFPQPGLGKI